MLSDNQLMHQQYLKTSAWRELRVKVLERDNYICCRCKTNPATEVHHKTYERWMEELLTDLESLCEICHEAHHAAERALGRRNPKDKGKQGINKKAIWNFLTADQKETLIKLFNLKGEFDLYSVICVKSKKKICDAGAKMLGFDFCYFQKFNYTYKERKIFKREHEESLKQAKLRHKNEKIKRKEAESKIKFDVELLNRKKLHAIENKSENIRLGQDRDKPCEGFKID